MAQPDPEQDAPDVTASESDAGAQSPAAGGGSYRDADDALAEGADDFEEIDFDDEDEGDDRETIDDRSVFERAVAFVNGVGLLAEGVGPSAESSWGNFPQAFSHIRLVSAARAISEAELRPAPKVAP